MANWAIDINCESRGSLIISSKRKIGIKALDNVITFHRQWNDLAFAYYGIVDDIVQNKTDDTTSTYTVNLKAKTAIETALSLESLKFSLIKIYRFNQPLVHFRRSYLTLSDGDFNTIKDGDIYWPRTAFGMYANKLGRKQLLRFVQELAEDSPSLLLQQDDISLAWSKLKNFIYQEFVVALELINSIKADIDTLNFGAKTNIPSEKIGIELEYTKLRNRYQIGLLQRQQKLLTDFVDTVNHTEYKNIFELIDGRIRESRKLNERFESLFKGIKWPLQLI